MPEHDSLASYTSDPFEPSDAIHAGSVSDESGPRTAKRERAARAAAENADAPDAPAWSSWVGATHGPQPRPDWVITSGSAIDAELGVLKTGKEADVHLVSRTDPAGRSTLLAAKRYRSTEHRMFHRDAGYLEGRRVRRSRETRAMARRTDFGRTLIAGQWAAAEFAALSALWELGAPVPYPVQLIGEELMMQFIGTPEGVAAPRLANARLAPGQAGELFAQCRAAMTVLADSGYAHGDLSAYNLLVHDGRLVMIDLPQAVDVVANPQGPEFLHRDCVNICEWFARAGAADADADELFGDLMSRAAMRW